MATQLGSVVWFYIEEQIYVHKLDKGIKTIDFDNIYRESGFGGNITNLICYLVFPYSSLHITEKYLKSWEKKISTVRNQLTHLYQHSTTVLWL